MKREDIQGLKKELGVQGFVEAFDDALNGRNMPNGARLTPEHVHIRDMWEALVGPISDRSLVAQISEAGYGALDPTGFPTATEKLIASITIRGYNERRMIGDQLVPNSYTPTTLTERIEGFTTMSSPKQVMPGENYTAADFGEKYVTYEAAVHNKKEGYLIAVTEEVVRFDQTGNIIRQAQGIGRTLMTERERRTVRAVLGIGKDTGTTQSDVYYPLGVDTALYRASEFNLRTNNAPIVGADSELQDHTDIQEAYASHAQNVVDDRQVDPQRPIIWTPNRLLAPAGLIATLARIFQTTTTTFVPTFTAGTDPEFRQTSSNPIQMMMSMFGAGSVPFPLTSAFVDEVSTTAWVLYDADATFVRINVFPFQVFQAPPSYGWDRDIVSAYKAREWSRVVALDHKHVQKNQGA